LYIDLNKIALNFDKHSVSTIYFQDIKKFWESKIRDYYLEGLTKFKIGNRAPEFNFPYISQGRVDSANLFGINELILFAYYEKTIGTQYTKVLDLGANVGLHTIFISLLGGNVTAVEPDPITFKILSNNVSSAIVLNPPNLINAAAFTQDSKSIKFLRVLQNRTGSHVLGSRESMPYGGYEEIIVEGVSFTKLLNQAYDLVKIDVEGLEADLICSIDLGKFSKTSYLVEIGSQKNAKKIWHHIQSCKFNAFSQKNGWKSVRNLEEIPTHHTEGTLFVTSSNKMHW
jgi:FkbM family methyltransferase